jgi:hypothetical protein
MVREYTFKHILFMLAVIIFITAGCSSSPPARFYTLNPLNNTNINRNNTYREYNDIVAIGPVIIPDYLDRPQIVARAGRNELTLAEFDRWAGSLKEDVARVLLDNLSTFLHEKQVSVFAWKRAIPFDYRVTVNFSMFDIYPDDYVILKVSWVIFDSDGGTVVTMNDSSYKESIDGKGYDAAVAAMSRALAGLSRDMACGICETVSYEEEE